MIRLWRLNGYSRVFLNVLEIFVVFDLFLVEREKLQVFVMSCNRMNGSFDH
jgi:hypothetical protein